jgi:hypothetical protein
MRCGRKHGESIYQRTVSVAKEEDDRSGDDSMDKMLDAIRPELETNSYIRGAKVF